MPAPIQLTRRGDELSTARWRALIDQMAEMGLLQIHFSGGEPLVRKDIDELVSHAATAAVPEAVQLISLF